jgi:hypothetical protein
MDLKAANLADGRALRLTRISMIACFVVASVMLLASLAMAKSSNAVSVTNAAPPSVTTF